MPVIPRYDGTQLQQDSLPNARQTMLPASNIDIYGGMASGLNSVAVAMEKAQDDADKIRAFEARNQLQNAVTDSLYGQNGLFNRKGRDAAGALPMWEEGFDKQVAEIEKTLTPRQQQMFRDAAMTIRTPHREQVMRFEYDQIRKAEDQVLDSTITTALDTAKKNYNNEDIIKSNLSFAEGALLKKFRGAHGEVIEQARAALRSSMHTAVLEGAMANGNIDFANSYLKQYGGELVGEDGRRITDRIKGENDKVGALAGAQRAFASAPGDIQAGMNMLRDQFKDNPTALEYAQSELKSMYAEGEVIKRQQQDKATNAVADKLSKIRASGRVPRMADIAGPEFDALDPDKKLTFQNTIETLQDRAVRDARERKNDADRAHEKALDAAADKRYWQLVFGGDLKNHNLAQEASVFVGTPGGDAKLSSLMKMQEELRKGNTESLTSIQGPADKVNGYLKQLKIDPDSDQGIAAKSLMQNLLTDLERRKGNKATPQEIDNLAKDVFTKRELTTRWGDGRSDFNSAPFQMTDKNLADITIADVPKEEKAKIAADYYQYLKEQGMPQKTITDQIILEWYREGLRALGAGGAK